MISQILFLLLLLALSAFFSASEIALFSLSKARVSTLRDEGRAGSAALQRLKANPERMLATILLSNNVVNVGAASMATALALDLYGNRGVAYATGLMTLLILVFGEVTPKGLASANADRVSLFVAPIILIVSRVLVVAVYPLEKLTRSFVRRSQREGRMTVTEGEIREMTAIGHREGTVDELERRIIERAFRLDETRAWDIMTPRVDVFAWSGERSLASIISELPTIRYSRVPVYGDSVDDIVGILYTRDAYQALIEGQRDIALADLAREPFFVPGSIQLTHLLSDFQTRRIHMGIVIDEYGGTDGLITLEDILEELVGEIMDETDLDHQPVVRVSKNEVMVEGGADLREINHFFSTTLPQLEYRSLNGYLLDEFGHVPRAGELLETDGLTIQVVEASETQVLKALLRRHLTPAEEEGDEGKFEYANEGKEERAGVGRSG